MKTTIQDVLSKVHEIDHAILVVTNKLPKNYFPGQEPLCDVINLLAEYRDKILSSEIDI